MWYIVLDGFCPWVHGGCIACSRGRGGFQCGEDVYPSSHAQHTIKILQLHVCVYISIYIHTYTIYYEGQLYCNPGWKVHVIKGFCLWASWDLELWLDEEYTGGSLGYVVLRHGSQTSHTDNSRYLIACLVTYSCLVMTSLGSKHGAFYKGTYCVYNIW